MLVMIPPEVENPGQSPSAPILNCEWGVGPDEMNGDVSGHVAPLSVLVSNEKATPAGRLVMMTGTVTEAPPSTQVPRDMQGDAIPVPQDPATTESRPPTELVVGGPDGTFVRRRIGDPQTVWPAHAPTPVTTTVASTTSPASEPAESVKK